MDPFEANQEEWEKAVCRGINLLDCVRSPDGECAQMFEHEVETVQSQFTKFPEDFEKWGWYFYDPATINLAYARFDDVTWGLRRR